MKPSERLLMWRKERKITQQAAADLLGVKQGTVAGWESGSRNVGLTLIARVSKITKISRKQLRPDIFSPVTD